MSIPYHKTHMKICSAIVMILCDKLEIYCYQNDLNKTKFPCILYRHCPKFYYDNDTRNKAEYKLYSILKICIVEVGLFNPCTNYVL